MWGKSRGNHPVPQELLFYGLSNALYTLHKHARILQSLQEGVGLPPNTTPTTTMPPRKRTRQETRKGSGANPAEKKLEEDLSQISIDELRKQLVDIGENPGPIDGSNKYMHKHTFSSILHIILLTIPLPAGGYM